MRTTLSIFFSAVVLATAVPAQLRHAVADAQHVVIARHIGVRPLGNDFFLHRYEIRESLKGDAPTSFSITERKRIADMPQPKPGPDRILCLVPDHGAADFPQRFGPYFGRTGYRGDDPIVDDSDATRSTRELIRVLLQSEAGRSSGRTTTDLVTIALRGTGPARIEASETLRERTVLRDAITPIAREGLLLAAVAESDDIERKISLASLCAEAGHKTVVQAVCISLQSCDDPRLARAVGRIATHVHGEGALEALQPFLRQARGPVHDRLLLAIGSTGTQTALETLLTMRTKEGASPAVDAALRAHGSPRALEAAGERDRATPVEADRRR